ncbi:tetratricopeptide repeat protein [Iningainema tapete]|uniref:Tetratricopeptide repeat protein n=1 Tax=Iningainema tapete BLCC-T55 TaxID=2748662 RepID=A0A8J7C4B5_9CYAN|nr:tetratricopeptide repeat protein [Iningainema tapete]MBD2771224.1 tetratricopeptide repeat protein [Iningainema tapete BLCC-T55]
MDLRPPLPNNEIARLNALRQYQILDTPGEKVFDDFTFLAAQICNTPIALISLLDGNRQWFKSKVGLEASETSRDLAFCAYTILQQRPLIVRNALADDRFATNALVTSDPNIRFYAGAPLITPEGYAIGTLCVIDTIPRDLSAEQEESLRVLSGQIISQLELRRNAITLSQAILQKQENAAQLLRQQDYIEVYYHQGIEKAKKGNLRGAIADFNQYIQLNPNGGKAYNQRGIARRQIGDYKGAIADFDIYLRINPTDAEAHCNRGLLRFQLGDYKGAIADYSKAMEINPDYAFPTDLGFVTPEVVTSEAIVNYTPPSDWSNVKETEAYLIQGNGYYEVENGNGAIEHYNQSQSQQIILNDAQAYFHRAQARYELEDYSGAVEDYTESLRINPHQTEAYLSRANARLKLKDYYEAVEDYSQFIRLNPNDCKVYLSRAQARYELEDYSGAVEDYTQSLRISPHQMEAYLSRANARSKLKDYKGAIEDYTQFLRLNPNHSKAYISRGNARSKLKDYKGAIEDYKRVWSKSATQSPILPSADN